MAAALGHTRKKSRRLSQCDHGSPRSEDAALKRGAYPSNSVAFTSRGGPLETSGRYMRKPGNIGQDPRGSNKKLVNVPSVVAEPVARRQDFVSISWSWQGLPAEFRPGTSTPSPDT